ncbi:Hint domain-containing protein [uncultured Sulfitobacter sp.]|uniref:Hint domain-containing protein n=1 Tax=uncultured Sulfitobacter sp. TaxID=191468 RepID=UPI00262FC30C|nr:Hint domain-containing protein [uncultured Sulfitobacter sp.]
MPTAVSDQFFVIDPGNPPGFGTPLTFIREEFIDEDDDGDIRTNSGDTWGGNEVGQVWQGDTITVNVPGVGDVTYTGVTFYFVNGDPPVFTPTDGQVLQDGTFVSSTFVTTATETPVTDFGPTCFTPGMMIGTPDGPRAIETLAEGDLVQTVDAGAQPIRMILDGTFRAAGHLAPVHFTKGAIGNDAPLVVSPQHRVLISGWRAEFFYGQEEVLVAAVHLVNGDTIRQVGGGMVRYIHLLFDQHQMVFGQGVPSESCYPAHLETGAQSDAVAELARLFPKHKALAVDRMPFVRPVLGRTEAAVLVC